MAAGGGVLFLSSLTLLATQGFSFGSLALFALLMAGLAYGMSRFALSRVKKTGVSLETDQEGYQACTYPKELIGKVALVSSDLKPSGYIRIQNQIFAAVSKSGYIEKGFMVRLIGGEGAAFIVIQEESHHVSSSKL